MTRLPHTPQDVARACGLDYAPTPEQAAVIDHDLRPLLVIAGAGSGKTETMAARVVYLVANGVVTPDEVLGLTFTRKAATELGERIAERLGSLAASGLWTPPEDDFAATPTISTYHSYAGRLAREHGVRLGFEPESRLLTEAAAWQYAAEAVARYDGDMSAVTNAESTVIAGVQGLSGELAEHLATVSDLTAALDAAIADLDRVAAEAGKLTGDGLKVREALAARRAIVPIVSRYADLKRERDAMDFADQMALAARLAEQFPAIGAIERSRFKAVLLDEFQDTSEAQLRLLARLFVAEGEPVPVTAVGDPHQSIYGWRGASATTLAQFRTVFHDDAPAAFLPLATSWRNDAAILAAANTISAPLRESAVVPVPELAARPGAGPGRIEIARHHTYLDEAADVAAWLKAHHRPGRSAAVLCRKRSQFAAVIEQLAAVGLPYEVVGLGGLLITPEVSDLVAALRVSADPTRGDALMRLITGNPGRLGAADLAGLRAWIRASRPTQQSVEDRDDLKTGLGEAIDRLPPPSWVGGDGTSISATARDRLAQLAGVLRHLRGHGMLPLPELVGEAERALGLDIEVLGRPGYTPGVARAHLDAFADVAAEFSASADRPTINGFLAWLDAALAEERGLDAGVIEVDSSAVQVLTIHAAKGLEWDLVAVPGLVDGILPAREHSGSPKLIDDAYRLSPHKSSGWIKGLASLPYAIRGDVAGLPALSVAGCASAAELNKQILAFQHEVGAHEVREERRLAYVAFTRARHRLLLSSHVWNTGKTMRPVSPFLTELMEAHPDLPAREWVPEPAEGDVSPVNEAERRVVWPAAPETERFARLAAAADAVRRHSESEDAPLDVVRWGSDPDAAQGRRLLAERAARRDSSGARVDLPSHLSASQLVALAADPQRFARELRRPMPAPPATAARAGTAFHTWVEEHYKRASIVDIDELPGSADEDAAPDSDLPQLKANFLASEWAARTPHEIEIAIETVVDGIALRGRVDAVFARPDGGYTVVDWKTGAKPTGQDARTRALQLGAYALAYARLRGVPPEMVDAAFFYVGSGETIWPELPDLAELTAPLAGVPLAT